MKCAYCGAKNVKLERVEHKYVECGLPNVVLVNVPERVCGDCNERELVIPRIAELHELLSEMLRDKRAPLSPAEFRFLRKYLKRVDCVGEEIQT